MINVGIDFGSTYSTVSVYREEQKQLEAICQDQGSPFIPSVVALNKNRYESGKAAKVLTGKKDVKIFKAFKMLLPEKDPEMLAMRGYDEENTPEHIASVFLHDILKKVLEDMHEDRIGKLVVGVPEIWNEGIDTLDGRGVILKIASEFDFVDEVQAVSEPIGASAFFAHNFKISTGKDYEGSILMIDYGGGTLDITLTDVVPTMGGSEDSASVEIKVLERCGAGENQDRKIGKAGIVYMESVVAKAIQNCEDFEDEKLVYDSKFYKAVDTLEAELQNLTGTINDTFEEFGIDDMDDLYEENFTYIDYKGSELEISYGLLLEVYNDIIRDVLDEKLNSIIRFMEERNIAYKDSNLEKFKIAIVGGFGNFYLVKRQIKEKFKFSTYDKRTENIILNKSDCEKAISLGTALIAAGKVGIRKTAPFSIGVWAVTSDRKVSFNYAIRYKQDIEADKVYYARGIKDDAIRAFLALSGRIDKFLINLSDNDSTACQALVKEEYAKKMEDMIKSKGKTAAIGFSINQSDVVSIHVFDYDVMNKKVGTEINRIQLTKFRELFEITAIDA